MRTVGRHQVYDSLAEMLAPAHTALLVVDMQNDFCSPEGHFARYGRDVSHIQAIIPTIMRLVDGARRAGVQVVFIQQTTLPGQLSDSPAWTYFKTRDGKGWDYTLAGSWGEAFVDGLEPAPGEPVVRKNRPSAFHGTNLDLILRSRHIDTVLVCGCITQGCVLATTLDASFHDFYTVVAWDAVQSTSQELHQTALTFLGSRYDMVTTDEALALWAGAS